MQKYEKKKNIIIFLNFFIKSKKTYKIILDTFLKSMTGFYARKNETRSQTYDRIYRTDCPIKQSSIKKCERALATLKTNYYKREIQLANVTRKKRTYTHKSLNELMNRFKKKN